MRDYWNHCNMGTSVLSLDGNDRTDFAMNDLAWAHRTAPYPDDFDIGQRVLEDSCPQCGGSKLPGNHPANVFYPNDMMHRYLHNEVCVIRFLADKHFGIYKAGDWCSTYMCLTDTKSAISFRSDELRIEIKLYASRELMLQLITTEENARNGVE